MGIEGNVLQWITSFLSDRTQRVKVNNSHSLWTAVTSGVPQGSVLGPILFIIYINDFPVLLKNTCSLFADDAKLYGKVENNIDNQSLQDDLNNCTEWARTWLMEFNKKKCKVIHFGLKNQHFEYHIDGYSLTHTEEEKDLGGSGVLFWVGGCLGGGAVGEAVGGGGGGGEKTTNHFIT